MTADRLAHSARRHDPAQAQARERERLGHAPDAHRALVAVHERGGGAGARLVETPVHLVGQDPGTGLAGDLDDPGQVRLVEQRPGRVARVHEVDDLDATRGQPAQLIEVRQPAVVLAQAQLANLGAEARGDGRVLLVGGHERDDDVTRLHQGLVRQRVRADRAVGDENVTRRRRLVERCDRTTQPLRTLDRAVAEPHRDELRQEGRPVQAGDRQQLLHRHRVHAGLGQVVAAAGLPAVHPDLDAEVTNAHRHIMRRAGGGASRATACSYPSGLWPCRREKRHDAPAKGPFGPSPAGDRPAGCP